MRFVWQAVFKELNKGLMKKLGKLKYLINNTELKITVE